MKAVVIPDKFKGTLSSREAGEIIAEGMISVLPSCHILRLSAADGGEGTLDAYLHNAGGEKRFAHVLGPNGQRIEAPFAVLSDGTGVIESAQACGLLRAEKGSSPLHTDTRGVGLLIGAALDAGCRRLVVGIGGSATNDGGAGAAHSLGARFLDAAGCAFVPTGEALARLEKIDLSGFDRRVSEAEILVACDVENPLCGACGAAETYARQKGADEEAVKLLDANLLRLARVVKAQCGRDMLGLRGGGAAGGMGAGLWALFGASLVSGAELLLKLCDFERHVGDADFIVTGEGCLDAQSLCGKLPAAVAAHSLGKPVAAIGGLVRLSEAQIKGAGFVCAEQAAPEGLCFDEIKKRCKQDLFAASRRVAKRFAR